MTLSKAKLCCPLLLLVLKIACCTANEGQTSTGMAEENLKKLSVANNDLALRLYRKLTSHSSDNVFFSPLSLSTAFAMLFLGARGNTAEELRNALGYKKANLSDDLVHLTFNYLLTNILSTKDNRNNAYSLKLANALLLDKNYGFLQSYKHDVRNLYQASIQDVDFQTQSAKIVREINAWVKNKTNGKIDKLLDRLSPSTIMVILNAIYFKGTWKTEFDPKRTKPQKFYNNGYEFGAIDVQTMHTKASFPIASVDNLQALELPYKGDNISMIILLPNQRNGLNSLEKTITLEKLSSIRRQLHSRKVSVSLPKFKLQYSREMSSDMKSLGARSIFSGGADFSGMTASRGVHVSQVLHKAVIEVNEEGSEAAAVTGIVVHRMSITITPKFIVDHPFMFAIVDKRSDMVLFVGRVNKL